MKIDNNILNKKLELIQWLSSIEDKSTIEKLIAFKDEETKDWWSFISNEEKISIEKGLIDAQADKLNPHVKARKIYEKWL